MVIRSFSNDGRFIRHHKHDGGAMNEVSVPGYGVVVPAGRETGLSAIVTQFNKTFEDFEISVKAGKTFGDFGCWG